MCQPPEKASMFLVYDIRHEAYECLHTKNVTIPLSFHPLHLIKFSWQIQFKWAHGTCNTHHPVLHSQQHPHLSTITIKNTILQLYSCGAPRYVQIILRQHHKWCLRESSNVEGETGKKSFCHSLNMPLES